MTLNLRDFKNIRYSIQYGIENIFRWLPIVWNDRNWDHYYFFKVLTISPGELKYAPHLHCRNYRLLNVIVVTEADL